MVVRRPCDVRARKQITEQGRVPVTLIGSELSLSATVFQISCTTDDDDDDATEIGCSGGAPDTGVEPRCIQTSGSEEGVDS